MCGEDAIKARGLCKDYPLVRTLGGLLRRPFARTRRVRALEDVSFEVPYGHVVGIIGLNGAGKTTLLKLLCDLLAPDAGELRVLGHLLPAGGEQVRAAVGFVPNDERTFFWRLSGRANLEFFAALHGIPARAASRSIEALAATFGLADRLDRLFGNYSSGMRKRLAIVRALLHDPRILVMDEPTNSLDPHWSRFLRDYVRDYVRSRPGRAVVWSTHRLEELEQACDDVLMLDAGRSVRADAVNELGLAAKGMVG